MSGVKRTKGQWDSRECKTCGSRLKERLFIDMKTGFFQGFKWMAGSIGAIILLATCLATAQDPSATSAPPATQEGSDAVNMAGAVPSDPVIPADLSYGVSEVAKLAQSGAGDEVMLAYVNSNAQSIHPTADEIIYLNDLGVSEKVITAMLQTPATAVAPAQQPTQPVQPDQYAQTDQQYTQPGETYPLYQYDQNDQPAQQQVNPPAPPVALSAPVQTVDPNFFYTSMAPYGSWIQVPNYGLCWQPTVMAGNPGWRPYFDRGHWVYTDFGWYWQSDYSWGWAPFHYGRWSRVPRYGWVWMPGSMWGPSWVSWRQSDAYFGWAPLPIGSYFQTGIGLTFLGARVGVSFGFGLGMDDFTFVTAGRFYDPHPSRYAVPRTQMTTVFNNTTIINNITVNKNTIINPGMSRSRVASVAVSSRKPTSAVSIKAYSVAASPSNPKRMTSLDRSGKTLTVYQPRFENNRPPAASPTKTPVFINQKTTTPPASATTQRPVRTGNTSVASSPSYNARPAIATPSPTTRPGTVNASPASRVATPPPAADNNRIITRMPSRGKMPAPYQNQLNAKVS